MKPIPVNIRRLLGIITLDQMYTEFSLPIVTLIFFDHASRLFSPDTPMSVRSMWYGACISTPYLINLFFAPLFSTLSDEFGRKKFLFFEIFSSFFYSLLAGLGICFGNLWLLFTGFIIRGAFSRTNTTALSMIGDSCSRPDKMLFMSYLQVAICLGACIGPIIAGYLARGYYFTTLNFALPFFIAAGMALVNSALTYIFISETLSRRSSSAWPEGKHSRLSANLSAVHYVITHPDVLKTSIILILFQLGWSSYYQFIPPLLKTVYHFDAHLLGLFIGLIAFWLVISASVIFKIIYPALDSYRILIFSAMVEILGILMTIAVYYHLLPHFFLWLAAIPVSLGDVLAYITLSSIFSNIVPDHMQGKVTGINFLIVGLVWGTTGFMGGLIISYTPILPILLAPLGIIAALMVTITRYGKNMVLNYCGATA